MANKRLHLRIGLFLLAGFVVLGVVISVLGVSPNVFRVKKAESSRVGFNDVPGSSETPRKDEGADPAPAKGRANVGKLVSRSAAVDQPAQDSLARIAGAMERFEKIAPKLEATLDEYRKLAQSVNDLIPDLKKTNDAALETIREVNRTIPEVQKLIKSANEVMPDIRTAIRGVNETIPDVRKLVQSTNDAVGDVRKLTKDVNDTIPSVRKTIDEIAAAGRNWRMVGERANVMLESNEESIRNTIKNSETASKNIAETFNTENRNNLSTILRSSRERLPEILDQTELLLRQTRSTLRNVDKTIDLLNKEATPGTQERNGLIKGLSDSLEKIDRVIADVDEMLRATARSDGALHRLITDPGLYNHLDDAALMVTRLFPRLDRVLKDMEVFADKLARHPESLGLGGVVRPSSGIKEPPRSQLPR